MRGCSGTCWEPEGDHGRAETVPGPSQDQRGRTRRGRAWIPEHSFTHHSFIHSTEHTEHLLGDRVGAQSRDLGRGDGHPGDGWRGPRSRGRGSRRLNRDTHQRLPVPVPTRSRGEGSPEELGAPSASRFNLPKRRRHGSHFSQLVLGIKRETFSWENTPARAYPQTHCVHPDPARPARVPRGQSSLSSLGTAALSLWS